MSDVDEIMAIAMSPKAQTIKSPNKISSQQRQQESSAWFSPRQMKTSLPRKKYVDEEDEDDSDYEKSKQEDDEDKIQIRMKKNNKKRFF